MAASAVSASPLGPADAAEAWPEDAIQVGVVLGAWGVKGSLRVLPLASPAEALFSSKRWYLAPAEDLPQHGRGLRRVRDARQQGDHIVASLQEVGDRDAAEALRGQRVFVPRSSFPSTTPDEFYWVDLIGLAVHNREQQHLGQVLGLLDTGAHSVLRVGQPGMTASEELLIPFVAAYIDEVRLNERRIDVDWGADY
jgi:16S rRNA processing protein RimM